MRERARGIWRPASGAMIVGMVAVGVGFLLAGVGFFVVGMNMRPPGATTRHGGLFGFFENSTRSGKIGISSGFRG